MKKTFRLILLMFLLVALASCNLLKSDFELKDEVIENNVIEEAEEQKSPVNNIVLTNASKYVTNGPATRDYVFINVAGQNVGAMSLYNGKMIVPINNNYYLSNLSASYYYEYIPSNYIMAENKNDGLITLYDAYGHLVLSGRKYVDINISMTKEEEKDSDDKVIAKYVIENVTYQYYDELGAIISGSKKIRTNIETRVREDDYQGNTNDYEKNIGTKMDLDKFGLKGYYAIRSNSNLYVYNSDDELVNRLIIDSYSNFFGSSAIYGANGKLIIQKAYLRDFFAEEYDIIIDAMKYKFSSKTVDILTGEEKEIDLDYIITGLETFYDENNKPSYGLAKIRKIEEENVNTFESNVILSDDLEIIYELGDVDISSFKKLKDGMYYDTSTRRIFNSKLEPVLKLNSNDTILFKEELIIAYNNKYNRYGIIDYSGNIVVPFEYNSIDPIFIDGKVYAKDLNNKGKIINTKGEVTDLPKDTYYISAGLLLVTEIDNTETFSQGKIIDYSLNAITSFEFLSYSSPYPFQFSNMYGNHFVLQILKDSGKCDYILIDASLK